MVRITRISNRSVSAYASVQYIDTNGKLHFEILPPSREFIYAGYLRILGVNNPLIKRYYKENDYLVYRDTGYIWISSYAMNEKDLKRMGIGTIPVRQSLQTGKYILYRDFEISENQNEYVLDGSFISMGQPQILPVYGDILENVKSIDSYLIKPPIVPHTTYAHLRGSLYLPNRLTEIMAGFTVLKGSDEAEIDAEIQPYKYTDNSVDGYVVKTNEDAHLLGLILPEGLYYLQGPDLAACVDTPHIDLFGYLAGTVRISSEMSAKIIGTMTQDTSITGCIADNVVSLSGWLIDGDELTRELGASLARTYTYPCQRLEGFVLNTAGDDTHNDFGTLDAWMGDTPEVPEPRTPDRYKTINTRIGFLFAEITLRDRIGTQINSWVGGE